MLLHVRMSQSVCGQADVLMLVRFNLLLLLFHRFPYIKFAGENVQ